MILITYILFHVTIKQKSRFVYHIHTFITSADCPIKPKKKRFEEAHKLKQIITKTVNKAVEDEMRARATDGKTKLSKIQEAVASYNSASTSS